MSYKLNLIEGINEKALKFNAKTNNQCSFKSIGYPQVCHFESHDGNKILIKQRAGFRIQARRCTDETWAVIKFETALNEINWNQPMKDKGGNIYSI